MLGTIAAIFLASLAPAAPMRQFAVGTGIAPAPPSSNTYYQGEVIKLSPLVYLRLGEASGTTATDAMAFESGEYMYGPTLGVAGLLTSNTDTAISGDGTVMYVNLPDSPPITSTTFTVVVWTNMTAGDFRALAEKYNTTDAACAFGCGWELRMNAGGDITFISLGPISGWTVVSTAGSYDGAKHMVALRVGNGSASLYIDGVLDGAGPVEDISANTASLMVGAREGPALVFNGILDEFAYWTSDIGAAAILNLYTVGTTP